MACVGCGLEVGSWLDCDEVPFTKSGDEGLGRFDGNEGLVRFEGDDGSMVRRWSWLVKDGVGCRWDDDGG